MKSPFLLLPTLLTAGFVVALATRPAELPACSHGTQCRAEAQTIQTKINELTQRLSALNEPSRPVLPR